MKRQSTGKRAAAAVSAALIFALAALPAYAESNSWTSEMDVMPSETTAPAQTTINGDNMPSVITTTTTTSATTAPDIIEEEPETSPAYDMDFDYDPDEEDEEPEDEPDPDDEDYSLPDEEEDYDPDDGDEESGDETEPAVTTEFTTTEEDEDDIDYDEFIPVSTTAATTAATTQATTAATTQATTAATTKATTTAATTKAPSYTPVSETSMYAIDTARIRSGPGTDYSSIGMLYLTEGVKVIGTSGDWYAVSYNGMTGYIANFLLSSEKPETSATTAATSAPATSAAPSEQTVVTDDTTAPAPQIPEGNAETEQAVPSDVFDPFAEETTSLIPQFEEQTTEKKKTTTASTKKDEDDKPVAASTEDGNKPGGLQGLLIALASAVAAFVLIGVIPIVIHKIYHDKLYQY